MIESNEEYKISIIVPTYKRSHLISRAVESILNQTYKNFEIIIINDGPEDDTRKVVNEFNDNRIIFIQHPENKGIPITRNTGLIASTGYLIAFLDSDDEWLPEKLEKQVLSFKNAPDNLGVVYTERYDTVDNNIFIIPESNVKKREGYINDILLFGSLITLQTAMVKKECFSSVGMFDIDCPAFEDWELWLRISKIYQFKFINEPLAIIHSDPREEHVSKNYSYYISSMIHILNKHKIDFQNSPKIILANHNYYIASLLMRCNEWNKARQYLKQSIKHRPVNLKYTIAYTFSLFGFVVNRK